MHSHTNCYYGTIFRSTRKVNSLSDYNKLSDSLEQTKLSTTEVEGELPIFLFLFFLSKGGIGAGPMESRPEKWSTICRIGNNLSPWKLQSFLNYLILTVRGRTSSAKCNVCNTTVIGEKQSILLTLSLGNSSNGYQCLEHFTLEIV